MFRCVNGLALRAYSDVKRYSLSLKQPHHQRRLVKQQKAEGLGVGRSLQTRLKVHHVEISANRDQHID